MKEMVATSNLKADFNVSAEEREIDVVKDEITLLSGRLKTKSTRLEKLLGKQSQLIKENENVKESIAKTSALMSKLRSYLNEQVDLRESRSSIGPFSHSHKSSTMGRSGQNSVM